MYKVAIKFRDYLNFVKKPKNERCTPRPDEEVIIHEIKKSPVINFSFALFSMSQIF